MNWRNVRLIYGREIRDQLRDRRTLFMIAVLPLLLYPLLGMSVFQLSQFLRKSEPKVLVIGSAQLADGTDLPPLFHERRFAEALFDDPQSAARVNVEFDGGRTGAERVLDAAERRLKSGDVQVVLNFPPNFEERLGELRTQIGVGANGIVGRKAKPQAAGAAIDVPQPEILFNSGKEKSRIAHRQVTQLLNVWKSQIVRENLLAGRVPANLARPFEVKPLDVAEVQQQHAMIWSKVLPFVLFIWALTGAFYPAVDLCAGEKERGTLETLLSSPALRTEIVWGKLLTVMTFSGATALLNLASLGFTVRYTLSQLQMMPGGDFSEGLELPPLSAGLWLLMALVPMTALFSALCLACAAFARSTKEGQYYLMPLLLVTMPLMMLPMAPGAELNLGNSLIPVTGVVLLLKGLIQGNYSEVLHYVLPVCVVTLVCCHWAIRWAVYQFNQESVLFRESERFDVRRWIVHLVRDRQDTPSLAEAFVCVALIYVSQFFVGLAMSAHASASPSFGYLALLVFIGQVVCIALPALLMAVLLTGRPLKTLLLDRAPNAAACAAAVLLAVLLHPLGRQLSFWIYELYPVQEEVANSFAGLFDSAPYPWLPFVLLAVLPALCEELAFRGFVLSGLRHLGSKWWAIGLTAVFFGMAHTVIQQSMAAAAVGVIIGYVAVQSGSLVPCMLLHMSYNGLMFASAYLPQLAESRPGLSGLFHQPEPGHIVYDWPVAAACGLAAAGLLVWFHRLPYQATKEEQLNEARALQAQHPLAGGWQGNVE